MAKKSTKPKSERTPADGALPAEETSKMLVDSQAVEPAGRFSFHLTDLAEGMLNRLARNDAVVFVEFGQRIAAGRSSETIGFVPTSHLTRVRQIMNSRYSAWVSDVFDSGVEITVELK